MPLLPSHVRGKADSYLQEAMESGVPDVRAIVEIRRSADSYGKGAQEPMRPGESRLDYRKRLVEQHSSSLAQDSQPVIDYAQELGLKVQSFKTQSSIVVDGSVEAVAQLLEHGSVDSALLDQKFVCDLHQKV